MIRDSVMPLETYRLAHQAGQVDCYICDEGNTYEAEFCCRCQAPMALGHSVLSQKVAPQMIGVLGASGVGKTVYLGMLLDMLQRQASPLQFTARGAFSITLQQAAVGALQRCEFPDKTPNEPDRWNWVHCQVKSPKRRRPIEMIVPDMAGEALLEEIDHPHSFRVVRSLLQKSQGVLVLLDSTKLRRTRDQDYYGMKLMSYLQELNDHPRRGWRRRPIAMVLTKADECEECFADPAGFAQNHAVGLWKHCTEQFQSYKFFASGVAGACAWRETFSHGRVRAPLRIEPRGVVEPFEWLVENLP